MENEMDSSRESGKQYSKQLGEPLLRATQATVVCLIAASLCLYTDNQTSVANQSQRPEAVPSADFLKPAKPEEVHLLNWNQFLEAHQGADQNDGRESDLASGAAAKRSSYSVSDSCEQFIFVANLIFVGRHNLAALGGLSSHYLRQSPSGVLRMFSQWLPSPVGFNESVEAATEGFARGHDDRPHYYSDELKKKGFMKGIFKSSQGGKQYEIPSFPLNEQPDPERITHIDADWRRGLNEVRHQRDCGACYAFTWLALVEWHYFMQSGEKKDFSEQQLVDCGKLHQLNGCKGGKPILAKAASVITGLYEESEYPYVGKEQVCKKDEKKKFTDIEVTDYYQIVVNRENMEKTLDEQPIMVDVKIPNDIDDYSSGIHHGKNCYAGARKFGHAMLLVGYGRQNGKPYWLLRNSMGKSWGENGYMRLARDLEDMSACFDHAFVAKIRFAVVDEHDYIELYEKIKYKPERKIIDDKGDDNNFGGLKSIIKSKALKVV